MDVLRMEILKQQVEDNFGANEVDEVQMLFVEADADGNGMLNKAEVGAMCKTIGFNIHPEELDEGFEVMQRHHATNKHGEINYESFNDWWPPDAASCPLLRAHLRPRPPCSPAPRLLLPHGRWRGAGGSRRGCGTSTSRRGRTSCSRRARSRTAP